MVPKYWTHPSNQLIKDYPLTLEWYNVHTFNDRFNQNDHFLTRHGQSHPGTDSYITVCSVKRFSCIKAYMISNNYQLKYWKTLTFMATLENLEATRDYSVQLLINERNPKFMEYHNSSVSLTWYLSWLQNR